ncbi:MAG: hypothetical protein J5630_01455 [Bacteroidaceae bacterium]|nr:hypothetical protein [Bacteroidaceae bacterium]
MKKIFKSLMFLAIGAITLASCEDVPAPYTVPGGNTGSLPYNSTSLNTDWTTESLNGLYNPWSQGSSYTQATGYQKWDGAETESNKECEGLLISPALNTASNSADGVVVSFQYILAYDNQDPQYADHIKLYVYQENADGTAPEMSTWTQLPLQLIPRTGSSWDVFNTESIQLPEDFVNKENVRLAFWFYSPAEKSATYELKSFTVQDGKAGGDVDPTPTEGTRVTCAEAVELTNDLADGATSTETYTVTGYITEVVGSVSRNQQTFWMADTKDGGQVFEAYWANLPEGVSAFVKGSKVEITGALTKYVNKTSGAVTAEIKNANVVILEAGEDSGDDDPSSGDDDPSTTSEYMSIANLPSVGTNSYGSQSVADELTWLSWTWNNVDFKGAKLCKGKDDNGGGIQVQGNASDATKQGFIFNSTAWPTNIQKITIVLKVVTTSTYDPSYTLYAGDEAHPTTTEITPASTNEEVDGFRVYTQVFDLSNANAKYFTIANNLAGALYIDKIYVE